MQEIADTDGGDQNRQGWCLTQGAVGQPFDHHAQNRAYDHGQDDGQHRVKPRSAKGEVNNITADHDDIAVGEVQHLGNAVDHGVAQGNQCINTAQADTVDQVRKELHCVHLTLFCRFVPCQQSLPQLAVWGT